MAEHTVNGAYDLLQKIVDDSRAFEGRRGEEEFEDTEDAFTNGCEVGEWETLQRYVKDARRLLRNRAQRLRRVPARGFVCGRCGEVHKTDGVEAAKCSRREDR